MQRVLWDLGGQLSTTEGPAVRGARLGVVGVGGVAVDYGTTGPLPRKAIGSPRVGSLVSEALPRIPVEQ